MDTEKEITAKMVGGTQEITCSQAGMPGILHKIAGTLITRSRVGIREIVSSQVGIQIIPSKTGTI